MRVVICPFVIRPSSVRSRCQECLVSVSSRTKSSTSRSCLGLEPMRLGSCLGFGAICLGFGPVGLVSGHGPLRLVETFCAVHTVAAVRAILTSMTFVA